MRKVLFLAYFCRAIAARRLVYEESDCKEGPVWKALCRPQEVWAKFLGHMTACQLFPLPVSSFYFVLVSITFFLLYLP